MKQLILNYFVNLFLTRRWQKRLFKSLTPNQAWRSINNGSAKIFYSPRAMGGPSFDISNQKEAGFINYEKKSKDEFIKLIPPNGTCFDIGANIGLFTTYIALNRTDVIIHSFEPEQFAFSCLKNSVKSIQTSKITPHNFALGEQEEDIKIHLSPKNDGGHTLLPNRAYSDKNFIPSEIIKVHNPQSLISSGKIPSPLALKIDVEGFEAQVLKGLISELIKNKPLMLIELNNAEVLEKKEIFQLLSSIYDGQPDIFFKIPEDKKEEFPFKELCNLAHQQHLNGKVLSNYLIYRRST